MSTCAAHILAESCTAFDEAYKVASRYAGERMRHAHEAVNGLQERVTAPAGVLDAVVPRRDGVHPMPEEAAEIPHLLREQGSVHIRVCFGAEQQWVAAADAGVFVMAVSFSEPLVCVVTKKAGERMTNPCV